MVLTAMDTFVAASIGPAGTPHRGRTLAAGGPGVSPSASPPSQRLGVRRSGSPLVSVMPAARRIHRGPSFPDDYWRSLEGTVGSVAGFLEAVRMISAYQSATGTRFVWRGAADADWPLHPSLVRRYIERHGGMPTEAQLRASETAVIREARDWGLDWHDSEGRLEVLELLAALQHFGIPTRLLDFTFNPLVAFWFATENLDDRDGRVFAIDISDRLISQEDAGAREPWWFNTPPGAATDWSTQAWIWRPPPLEARIVRQDGCFLMGGIPSTQPPRNVQLHGVWRLMRAAEVRACMSVPFRLIHYDQAAAAFEGRRFPGHPPRARAFTLRATGDKADLKTELEQGFGLTYRSLFPDFPGLARYGQSF